MPLFEYHSSESAYTHEEQMFGPHRCVFDGPIEGGEGWNCGRKGTHPKQVLHETG